MSYTATHTNYTDLMAMAPYTFYYTSSNCMLAIILIMFLCICGEAEVWSSPGTTFEV